MRFCGNQQNGSYQEAGFVEILLHLAAFCVSSLTAPIAACKKNKRKKTYMCLCTSKVLLEKKEGRKAGKLCPSEVEVRLERG